MRALAIAAAALAGCFSPTPPTGVGCGPNFECPPGQFCDFSTQTCEVEGGDGDGDGGVELSCEDWTFDPNVIDPCAISLPGPPLVASGGAILDTDTGELVGGDSGSIDLAVAEVALGGERHQVAIASVRSFEIPIGSSLRITGSRPLLIVSWEDARIDGDLNADADITFPGPGADLGPCLDNLPDDPLEGGAGGGGIGGFGGVGGSVNGNMPPPTATLPLGFYGGCSAQGNEQAGAGFGGGGGGAVGVVARLQLQVSGAISASGGGGQGGISSGGGGGGGGGLIVLVGDRVAIEGTITANGGGGGGGGDGGTPEEAQPGQAGQRSEFAAQGGDGLPNAGRGGEGGAQIPSRDGQAGQGPADATAGGGGGGGAAGAVLISSETPPALGGIISPSP